MVGKDGQRKVKGKLKKSSKKIISALAGVALAATIGCAFASPAFAAGGTLVEIQGADRYETSYKSTMSFVEDVEASGGTVKNVIIASGANFADALAATGIAGILNAPVLLTTSNTLSDYAGEALIQIDPVNVIIIGGTQSVSANVEEDISDLLQGASVMRCYGQSRVQTAEKIYELGVGDWSNTAILVTGTDYADALSASAYSYATNSPIFLIDGSGEMSTVTKYRLTSGAFDRVVIVGGSAVVSEEVEDSLESSGVQVERWAGNNRYQTSSIVALNAMDEGVLDIDEVGVASGRNYPDALSASAVIGRKSGILILADGSSSGLSAIDDLLGGSTDVSTVTVFGGTSSVAQSVRDHIVSLIS